MNNRKMLEIAAKAAGIRVPTKKDYPYEYIDEHGIHRDTSCGGDGSSMSHWNPFTNSGQALELAVRVPIVAVLDEVWVTQRTSIAEWERDPIAATRLAIVKAVVEDWQDVTLEEEE